MGEGDWRAVRWFQAKCVGAGREYGLIPRFFERLEIPPGPQEDLFLMKLDEMLMFAKRKELADMEKQRSK